MAQGHISLSEFRKTTQPLGSCVSRVVVQSGARVLRDRDKRVCDMVATVYRRERGVREEPEAEHHLRVEEARGSLRSYSADVLCPRVGFPLRRGTNED
jgi:hypothetical protein